MRTKEWKCIDCGRFVAYETMDSGTSYGCSDYEYPEPLDPQLWCDKCANKEYKECLKLGTSMHNYWEKPNFQIKAMKKLGIIEKNYELIYENPELLK